MLALEKCTDIAGRTLLHQHWTCTSDGISTDGPNLGMVANSEGSHANDAIFEDERCAGLLGFKHTLGGLSEGFFS